MHQSISIVLATYNGENFIQAQLDSLIQQTRLPDELIISDDNSSDGTISIVKRFQSMSPFPVKIIQNTPGLGFRENFLEATRHATSDWIGFCDQDDVWRPDKLELCARHFGTPGITQIAHAADLIDATGNNIGRFDQGIYQNTIRGPLSYDVWSTFWGFSMVFRRDLLDTTPFHHRFVDYITPDHRIAHDRWVFFLGQILGKTAEISAPLVQYRQHGSNAFGAYTAKRRENRAEIRAQNATYIKATREMVAIIQNMPAELTANFPKFDKTRRYRSFRRPYVRSRCAIVSMRHRGHPGFFISPGTL